MFLLVQWWGCCGSAPGQSRTWSLKVQRHHLAPSVPKDLRHVITGVHAASFGVDPAHLPLVVAVHWPLRKRHIGRCMQMAEELFIIQNDRGLSSIPKREVGSLRRTSLFKNKF